MIVRRKKTIPKIINNKLFVTNQIIKNKIQRKPNIIGKPFPAALFG